MKHKLSVSCLHLYDPKRLALDLRLIREAGFDGVDMDMASQPARELLNRPDALSAARRIRKQVEDAGLELLQGHAPYNPYSPDHPDRAQAVREDMLRCIPFAAELGVPYAVFHPVRPVRSSDPLLEDRERLFDMNVALYERIVRECAGTGVVPCTENLFVRNAENNDLCGPGYTSDPAELNAVMDAVPGLMLCFDIGHALLSGREPAELVRAFGDRLRITHLHNNNHLCDLHVSPFELKTGHWQSFCDALGEIGYAGTVNLEVLWEEMPVPVLPAMYRFLHDSAALIDRMTREKVDLQAL